MFKNILRAYLEGRDTLANVERAIVSSPKPDLARQFVQEELGADWEIKSIFADIPPPPIGLPGVMKALRKNTPPIQSAEESEALTSLNATAVETFLAIPEPVGGFDAALRRLKTKLAAAPAPSVDAQSASAGDVATCFDEQPAERKLVLIESSRKRGVTKKIIGLPRHRPGSRDVLAAGKDLGDDGK